ncbi:MAG: helix-turn-helix transcriptional regulator [Thalassospira sp.]|uniref:helix-turn-helix domain-containing protein n=1 Tax=Thalassospira sp. TaxID=1912094 RepID=UPI0032EB5DB6
MSKLDYQIASTHQIHQDIAQRLNRYRIHLELTQQELADEAGISVPTLSRLLNAKGATLDTFLRVLKAMNLLEAMAAYIPEPRDSPLAPRRARSIADRQRVRGKSEVPVWKGFDDTAPVFDDD